jgi:Tfp pilus assembly protein PilN
MAAGSRVTDASGAVKEVTVKRVQLLVTGLAPSDVDVANFIGHLSASPLFEDVNMGYAKNVVVRGRTAREFQATCFVAR